MRVIPAIDLMGGKCVRLVKGEKTNIINYDKLPMQVAAYYSQEGAKYLHIIDLDGAFTGRMKNFDIIKELAKNYSIQVGGGVRNEEIIIKLLDVGVKKVIASTLLIKSPSLATKLKQKYKGKLIGSFDFKNGKINYSGWTKQSELSFEKVAKGLSEIVVTDISKDGTFNGPNIELLKSIREVFKGKIIAAGGIRDLEDLCELRNIGMDGAIIGRAGLENSISLKDCLKFELVGAD